MNGCNEGEDDKPLPAQQTQQPQPVHGRQNEGWAARTGSLPHDVLESSEKNRSDEGRADGPDDARFTAGVVRFYEAILKEPIPNKMLRLIEEIAKQEHKS